MALFGGRSDRDAPSLPYDPSALAPAERAAACQLIAPTGDFHAPHAIALFQPRMADVVSAAIRALNDQGIVPTITDGYRTEAMQRRRRADARSGRSHNGAAQGISGHQVGLSVDYGLSSNQGNNAAIRRAMTEAGLANGANFSTPDPVHYMAPNTIRSQTAALAAACAAAYAGR